VARRARPTEPEAGGGALRAARSDGFYSLLNGIGGALDPGASVRFCFEPLSNREAQSLWRGNHVAAKIVEKKPQAAWKRGMRIKAPDQAKADDVTRELYKLGLDCEFTRAGEYENAYGGAVVWPMVDDASPDYSNPIRAGRSTSIKCLRTLEPRHMTPVSYYRDIGHPKYGRPMRYRITASSRGGTTQNGQLVHESRLIVFPGVEVALDQVSFNPGFGDSILNRAHSVVNMYGISWAGIATLLQRIEQGVLQMEGLGKILAEDDERVAVEAMIRLDKLRSLLKMLVIDKNDTFTRHGVPLTGVRDIMELLMCEVSSAADMPQTALFGRSPAGQNATGESDEQVWDRDVGSYQTKRLEPRVKDLAIRYMTSNDSVTGGVELEDWSVEWLPLREPTEQEIAETNDKQSSADDRYIQNQTLTPAIVRRNRFGAERSLATTITEQELAELERAEAAPTPEQIAAVRGADPAADPAQPEPPTPED
jgi:phage-related protein (TIGR01555 family)